jgi:hypothetical protein
MMLTFYQNFDTKMKNLDMKSNNRAEPNYINRAVVMEVFL